MANGEDNGLPFVTRKMLAFEQGTSFGIQIRCWSILATTLRLSGFTKEGPFSFNFPVIVSGGSQVFNFALPDVPIGISLLAATNSGIKGEIFAVATMTMDGIAIQQLASGYVWSSGVFTWPAPAGENAGYDKFETLLIESADPAAGAEATITIDNQQTWKLHSAVITLVTDATVATRQVKLLITPFLATQGYTMFSTATQTAAQTRRYNFIGAQQAVTSNDGLRFIIPIPSPILMSQSAVISTLTEGLQAGDNFGKLSLQIERFWLPTF